MYQVTKRKGDDFRNSIISIIYATIIVTLTAMLYFTTDMSDFDAENTPAQVLVVELALSYVIFDIIACIYYQLLSINIFIHHFLTINLYIIVIYSNYGACCNVCTLLILSLLSLLLIVGLLLHELSIPLLELRILLVIIHKRNTLFYEILEICYFCIYIISRTIIYPFAHY